MDVKIRQGAVATITPDFPAILHGDVARVVDTLAQRASRVLVAPWRNIWWLMSASSRLSPVA